MRPLKVNNVFFRKTAVLSQQGRLRQSADRLMLIECQTNFFMNKELQVQNNAKTTHHKERKYIVCKHVKDRISERRAKLV